jgi:hypothetical protein
MGLHGLLQGQLYLFFYRNWVRVFTKLSQLLTTQRCLTQIPVPYMKTITIQLIYLTT